MGPFQVSPMGFGTWAWCVRAALRCAALRTACACCCRRRCLAGHACTPLRGITQAGMTAHLAAAPRPPRRAPARLPAAPLCTAPPPAPRLAGATSCCGATRRAWMRSCRRCSTCWSPRASTSLTPQTATVRGCACGCSSCGVRACLVPCESAGCTGVGGCCTAGAPPALLHPPAHQLALPPPRGRRHGQAQRAQRAASGPLPGWVPRLGGAAGQRAHRHQACRLPLAPDAQAVGGRLPRQPGAHRPGAPGAGAAALVDRQLCTTPGAADVGRAGGDLRGGE